MTKLYSIKSLRPLLPLDSTVAPLRGFFYPMDLRGRGSSWMFRYVVDSKGFWLQKNDKYMSQSENWFDVSEIAGTSGLDLDDLELVPFESNASQHSEVQRHPFRYGHPGGTPILPLQFTARQFLWFEKTCLPSPLRDYWFLRNSTTEAEQLAELKKTNHDAAELARICLSGVAPDEPEEMPTAALPATTPGPAPVVAESALGGVSWTLKKPQRFHGYSKPLHDLLKAAQVAGRPIPNARVVLDAWREKAPLPLELAQVLADSLDYYDAEGNTKSASLNAIRKAIGRMTS